jgi:pyoverdine/dityrosine biosynthesis protein Dit1
MKVIDPEMSMSSNHRAVAIRILHEVMAYQRKSDAADRCASNPCETCMGVHLARVEHFVAQGRPVELILPAFPGKSPNLHKVLGCLPDMAELLSLEFLQSLCLRIQQIHPPGARLIICSDGRVFADLVRIPDSTLSLYEEELRSMMMRLGTHCLEFYGLDDEYRGRSFDEMRRELVETHGEPLDALREDIHRGGEALSLYRGITRFLLEDASGPDNTRSRTALQKECRARALGVIQRSKAWGELIARKYPRAVRLSIHPQPCGSAKLGINLVEAANNWMTPWHGAAVELKGRFVLMKRQQAESLGAKLVFSEGRPSHYRLEDAQPEALLLTGS